MKVIKEFINDNKYYILLFLIPFIKVSQLLTDDDYYWQKFLGEQEFLHLDYHATDKLFWGTIDIVPYSDHEWLSNIIFYLFSNNLFILKFIITLLFSVVFLLLIKEFEKHLNVSKVYIISIFEMLLSMSAIAIKPFTFSVILFMFELIVLNRYRKDNNIKYIIWSCLIVILWNNLHSGSVVLYFIVAGLFWLLEHRNKKTLLIGVTNIISLLITPYGYHAILDSIHHIGLKGDKYYTPEWQSLDTGTMLGAVTCIILFVLIYFIAKGDLKNKKYELSLLFLSIFMVCNSIRHMIYILPISIIILSNIDINDNDNLKKFDFYIKPFIFMIFGLIIGLQIYTVGFSDIEKEQYLYEDSKLVKALKDNDSEGIGLVTDIETIKYGIPEFASGVFPPCAERWVEFRYCLTSAEDLYIEDFIDRYNVSSFCVPKYNTTYQGLKTYPYTNIYCYFIANKDKMKLIYEDENYIYFKINERKEDLER